MEVELPSWLMFEMFDLKVQFFVNGLKHVKRLGRKSLSAPTLAYDSLNFMHTLHQTCSPRELLNPTHQASHHLNRIAT